MSGIFRFSNFFKFFYFFNVFDFFNFFSFFDCFNFFNFSNLFNFFNFFQGGLKGYGAGISMDLQRSSHMHGVCIQYAYTMHMR